MTGDGSPVDVLSTPEAGERSFAAVSCEAVATRRDRLGAATSVFLLRGLSVEDFGRYATVAALIGIVSTVTDAGLTAVGARELALRPRGEPRLELLRTLLGLRILLTMVGIAVAVVFAIVAGYDETMVWAPCSRGSGSCS